MNQEKIGKFIQERRKLKKLTQEELAEKLGVNNRSISRWENGKCMPDLSILKILSNELDVTINDLLNGEIVKKEIYQETFEENTINLMCYLKNHKDKFISILKILLNSIFITCVIIIFLFLLLVINAKCLIAEDYIDARMSVTNTSELQFNMKAKGGTLNHISRVINVNDEEITLVFVTWEYTILEKIQDEISNDNYNGNITAFIKDSNLTNNFKIYYTKENYKNIIEASKEELEKVIAKSYLMYEE